MTKCIALLCAVLFCFTATIRAADGPNVARPNVVLIISDDQGWDDYSFMGHPTVQTPRIDKLASQSLVFTRGYVVSPLCCPSLASILTGLHPHQHRITGNDPVKPQPRTLMVDTILASPRLPALLAPSGFVSYQTGKWWFDHYRHGGFTDGMTTEGRHGDAGLAIGRQTMQPMFDFMSRAKADRKPFFVWYAPMLPHTPHNPPERLLSKYQARGLSQNAAKYQANCEWFDETCGQLLDFIDQQELAQNTVVMYVTDNGFTVPDTGAVRAFGGPRGKRTPYEKGIRTPLMIRWPGHVEPRRDDRTLVSSLDIAPTVLMACGVKTPKMMTGVNLLDAAGLAQRTTIFSAAYEHDMADLSRPLASLDARVVIDGTWKLIAWRDGRRELFDLAADPTEKNDLATAQAERVQTMLRTLDNWLAVQ